MEGNFDVIIIGAGAVGCAIARELSRYKISIAVIEKECDAAAGTSGRNSAVVHAGFNNRPGTLMARFCVEGNQGFEQLCAELDVPYRKTGKLLVGFDEEDRQALGRLIEQGRQNGCRGLRMAEKDELEKIIPDVGGICAMYSPETAVFDPFLYTLSLAENAYDNGVSFLFNRRVCSIRKQEIVDPGNERDHAAGVFEIKTDKGEIFYSRVLINSAGLASAEVAAMAGIDGYHIYPCRGEYLILDKSASQKLPLPVYPVPKPGAGGLGVHLTPTVHGNVIIGPSAEYIDDGEDCSTTQAVMDDLIAQAQSLLHTIKKSEIIGTYAGIRSKQTPPGVGGYADFVIKEELPGFIDLIGIESPGMTASAPIARYVAGIVGNIINLEKDPDFDPVHKNILKFAQQSSERQAQLIAENPEYGEVICRCNTVTKAEIRQAIENRFGVHSIAAVKYRAWVTTGRCQGGYCLAKIAAMLVNEYGMKPEEITNRGEGSELFTGYVK